jgi:DNA-binding GntR family transcriptional regulator
MNPPSIEPGLEALLNPDRSPRLADRAYTQLRELIIEGRIPPGTRLVEQALTAALHVGRTPLREALLRLEHDAVIERRDAGSLYVTELSSEELSELLGMRAVLESYCARLAAARITDRELDDIADAHRTAVEAEAKGDFVALAAAGTRFHDLINAASRAHRCTSVINDLRDWAVRYRPQGLTTTANRQLSIEHHAAILEALRAHDADRAEQLVRHHLDKVSEVIRDAAPGADGP